MVIPKFAQIIGSLSDVLEEAYARAGKCTKRCIKKIALHTLYWGSLQEKDFRDLQDSLRNAVTLLYNAPHKTICVFADACELYVSGAVI